jgi:hypothetical protein
MKARLLWLALPLIALAVLLLWPRHEPPIAPTPSVATAVPAVPVDVPAVVAPVPKPVRVAPSPAAIATQNELDSVQSAVRDFDARFDGNPVGTNAEITKTLQGDNLRRVNFLGKDSQRINANGELVDAWGTPYFFHQLSARQMEIRSAGPDKRMWTEDDIVMR